MVDVMRCLPNLLFFDIPFLYCYTNLNSSIICYFSSGDMYLFIGASILSSEYDFLDFSAEDFSETIVILSAISLPIKSSVASAVF